ncbi:Scaffold-type E3 ligase [Monosporozyma unispora]|nr:Scaffold-type E3 ligase [Kazachstania unispora]
MSTEEDLIKGFVELTNCRRESARSYLQDNNWNINYALNEFYDKEGSFTHDREPEQKIYPKDLIDLFEKYADPATADGTRVITFEGMIQFIGDLGLSLEDDLMTIVLAKLLSWKKMTDPITSEEFLSTWFMQGCSHIKEMKIFLAELDHRLYHDPTYFVEIYNYTFNLILDEKAKQLDTNTAIEYWKIFLLQPKEPAPIQIELDMVSMWLNFLQAEKKDLISADCWQMIMQFFQRYPTFQDLATNYDETAAWPYIIDEFYEYLEDEGKI